MQRFVVLTLNGLTEGSIYAAMALALVMIWRATQVVNFAQGAMVMGLLLLLFQRTDLGLRMRAAAFNPEVSRLLGIRVGRMLTLGWALASVVGALAGLLIAPSLLL